MNCTATNPQQLRKEEYGGIVVLYTLEKQWDLGRIILPDFAASNPPHQYFPKML